MCPFNQAIARVETNCHNAANVESESSQITSVVSERRENEEHDTSTDTTSQRDSTFDSSLDRTDLEKIHIMSEASSSGM